MKLRQVSVWSIGFLCSCLFIWMVSAVFSNGIAPVEWDDELGVFVRSEGSVVRFRSEGWSDTRIGRHGLTVAGEAALKSSLPKFILWGDSFAEGLQIDDSLRAANLYNAMSDSMKAFTVAGGGLGVADYYFNIPRYENLAGNIDGHAILLVGMDDIMPEQHVACHSRFMADPWRFEESACEPSDFAIRYASFASTWRLEPIYTLYRFMKEHQFRFAPGHVGGNERNKTATLHKNLKQAWGFLVAGLKAQTSGFIVFVYVPPVPVLKDGRIVTLNPEEAQKEQFRKICKTHGLGFVDLSQPFFDLYAGHRLLSRGFFNSPPGGHLNEDGQRLIAEALYAYSKGKK
ncbi:MAG: hypothetical protein JEY79_09755 [Pseudodesulfovibrio sp.]|nr:hypothetical protein [Pseudodesulfovibrio sp.]